MINQLCLVSVLDEASEETDTTGGCEVTNMLVTSDGEPQEQVRNAISFQHNWLVDTQRAIYSKHCAVNLFSIVTKYCTIKHYS